MTNFISKRGNVANFLVMDLFEQARRLEEKGKKIIHFEAGQPTAKLPNRVFKKAINIMKTSSVGYTNPLGADLLREKISSLYLRKYKIKIEPKKIIITFGSSAAFILAFLSAFDKGDTIGITVPNYPAYKNMLKAFDLKLKPIFCNSKKNFKFNFKNVSKFKNLKGLLISNPLNPTGSILDQDELKKISFFCKKNNIRIISDEIYHGINFSGSDNSILRTNNEAIIINSFSKYFLMTGWRVGWLVCPDDLYESVKNLAPNLFVAPPTISQHVALSVLDEEKYLQKIVQEYKENMEVLYKFLPSCGIKPVLKPKGSFYLYADVSDITDNSVDFCKKLLNNHGVVLTPGIDFDPYEGDKYIRFCFSYPKKSVLEGIKKLNSIFS